MPTSMRHVYAPRMLRKFESIDGLTSFIFSLIDYEWESTQGLRVPEMAIIGMHYGFDMLGTGVGLKTFGEERLRFSIHSKCGIAELDDEVASLRYKLFSIGLGYGWTMNYEGVKRWAEMRITDIPLYTVLNLAEPVTQKLIGASASFRRQSDWFAEEPITKIQAITASGQSFIVSNPGNLATERMTIRLRANTSGGFTNPVVTNLTNNYVFQSNRDSASTSSELKLDTRRPAVEFSSNDGITYSDDFSNYVLPPVTKRALSFRLEPGDNTIRYTGSGSPNLSIEFEADAPFA